MRVPVKFIWCTDNQLQDSSIDFIISYMKYNCELKGVFLSNNQISKDSPRV